MIFKNKQALPSKKTLHTALEFNVTKSTNITKFKKSELSHKVKRKTLPYKKTIIQNNFNEALNKRVWNQNLLDMARIGDLPALKIALQKGADINTADSMMHKTPLMFAAMYNNYDCVDFLISQNADIHKKDIHGDQAISLATICDCPKSVDRLIHAGADFIPIPKQSDFVSLETRRVHKELVERTNNKIRLYKEIMHIEKEKRVLHDKNIEQLKTNTIQIKRRPRQKPKA